MSVTKAGTVKETGAQARDVLIGIEDRNKGLQIRLDRDQERKGGWIVGAFEILDCGKGDYSDVLAVRHCSSVREEVDRIRRAGREKMTHVFNRNGFRVLRSD